MQAPLSSRNKNSNLEGKEASSGDLKIYRTRNNVEGVIALARIVERVENCDQEERFG